MTGDTYCIQLASPFKSATKSILLLSVIWVALPPAASMCQEQTTCQGFQSISRRRSCHSCYIDPLNVFLTGDRDLSQPLMPARYCADCLDFEFQNASVRCGWCGDSGRCLLFYPRSSNNCSSESFGCPCEHWFFHQRDPNYLEPDWYAGTDILSYPDRRRTPTICCAAYGSCEDCRRSRCSWCRNCGAETCVRNVTDEEGNVRREDPYMYRQVLFNGNLSYPEAYLSTHNASISYLAGHELTFNQTNYTVEVSAGKFIIAACSAQNCSCDANGTSSTLSPWNKDCGCGCKAITTHCTEANCSCSLSESSSGVKAEVVTHSGYGPCGCECVESSRAYCTKSNCSCSQGVGGGLSLTHTIKNYDCGCGCSRATLPDQLTRSGCEAAGGSWTWGECGACRGRYGCTLPEGRSKCGPYPDPALD